MKKTIWIIWALIIVLVIAWLFYFNGSVGNTDYTGKVVTVDYVWTYPDGQVFDTNIESVAKENALYTPDRTYAPLSFTVWGNQVIKWFGDAVNGLKVGKSRKITVEPKDWYGEYDETKKSRIEKSLFQEAWLEAKVWQTYQIGWQIVTVTEITDTEVVVDSNHPMAGKTLIFDITLRSVEKDDSKWETSRGVSQ